MTEMPAKLASAEPAATSAAIGRRILGALALLVRKHGRENVIAALAPLLLPKLTEGVLRQRALSAALRGKPVAPTEAELLRANVLAQAIIDASPSGKPRGRGGRSKITMLQRAAIQQAMRERVPKTKRYGTPTAAAASVQSDLFAGKLRYRGAPVPKGDLSPRTILNEYKKARDLASAAGSGNYK